MSETPEPPAPTSGTPGDSDAAAAAAERESQCDREFDHYAEERKEWVKAQLESERRYDTLLTSICTLALGASLLKDFVNRGGTAGVVFMVAAWVGFAACLILTLLHQYFTYETHRRWLAEVDAQFQDWKPGAMGRALEKYDQIPFIKRVEGLKFWAGVSVLVGIVFSGCFLVSTIGAQASLPPPPAAGVTPGGIPGFSQTINVLPDTGRLPVTPAPPSTQPATP